jgi:hypothetical protein
MKFTDVNRRRASKQLVNELLGLLGPEEKGPATQFKSALIRVWSRLRS